MAGPFFNDAGKAITTNLVAGLGGTVPKYAAIGTGAGPANSAAAALTTEVETRSGVNAPTRVTTNVANDTIQIVQTIAITAPRAITEIAFFDQLALGGSMFISSGIAVINLANGDSIQLTGKLTYS